MFYSQNSTFIPNIISTTNDQEQRIHRRKNEKLFRNAGNYQTPTPGKLNQHKIPYLKGENIPDKQNCPEVKKSINSEQSFITKDSGKLKKTAQKANIIIAFSSDEEESQQSQQKPHDMSQTVQVLTRQQMVKTNDELQLPNRKINNLLLAFSDQQQIQQEQKSQLVNQQSRQKQAISKTVKLIKQEDPNNLILEFEEESDISQMIVDENGVNIYNKYKKQSLFNSLSCNLQDRFYLQSVPENMILQCIIKREKKVNGVIYNIYDSTTLRNFMTILKDEDGYLIISNSDLSKSKSSINSKQVVARLTSNFFGTQFNCYLCNYQYKKSSKYPIDPDKDEQAITIQYETNFFGFKGPRKMTAFIPMIDKNIVNNGSSLSKIYQKEKKKKIQASVLKFKNKTPKWNKNIEAYVLNFYGRATISSIKNFIMIKANQNEEADARVLFGKFGKELFNLDIRHPFNLMQGISLALSSFDRKLACE